MFSKNQLKENLFKTMNSIGLLEAPISVQWISTHECNFCCKHCMVNAGKPLYDELTTKEIKITIQEMSKMGVKYFVATGGEPLLRKDIFEVLKYAKEKGLKIGLATNGTFVSKYSIELENLHLDTVMISLDGLEKNHNKLRNNKNSFSQVINSIKFFKKIRIPKISVCTTVNRLNLNELEEIKKLIFSIGANHWYINITIPEGRAKNKNWLYLNNIQTLELFNFIVKNKEHFRIDICSEAGYLGEWDKKVRNNSFFCGCGWTSCAIMANGDVMACPIFEKNDFVEGNIKETPFKKIWEKGLVKFRNIKLSEKCYSCNHYSKCRGGCKVMRIIDSECLKNVWDKRPK